MTVLVASTAIPLAALIWQLPRHPTAARSAALAVCVMMLLLLVRAVLASRLQNRMDDAQRQILVTDRVTGLPNRAGLFPEITRAGLLGKPVALLRVRLDDLEDVHDAVGLDLAKATELSWGRLAERTLPKNSILARLGDLHYCAILPITNGTKPADPEDPNFAENAANQVRDRLEDLLGATSPGTGVHIKLSGGACLTQIDDEETLDQALSLASLARRRPGTSHIGTTEMRAQWNRQTRIAQHVRDDISMDRLEVYAQPLVELPTGHQIGCEALARWHSPEYGLLSGGEVIPIAESLGLAAGLDLHIARQALQERNTNNPNTIISLNCTPGSLLSPAYLNGMINILTTQNPWPGTVWIEIIEAELSADADELFPPLLRLRAAGAKIVIDDFGAGFSNLQRLASLPLAGAKLDMSLISNIETDQRQQTVVTMMQAMTEQLGLFLVVEGIERPTQATKLTELGTKLAQGYLYGKPSPMRNIKPPGTHTQESGMQDLRNSNTADASGLPRA